MSRVNGNDANELDRCPTLRRWAVKAWPPGVKYDRT